MTPPNVRLSVWEQQVWDSGGKKYFEMLLYTSSAGRSGMLVFARVKNAIFSLESHSKRSQRVLLLKRAKKTWNWDPIWYLKVWTSGTSLRLCPLILWTSLAAALIIFSTRFSCSCSSRVWAGQRRQLWWKNRKLSSPEGGPHRSPVTHLLLGLPEEEAEAFVLLDPGGQLSLALLPRLLQLRLQLAQHVQLLRQPGLPRPRHLQVQLQVQGGAKQTVQTFDLHRGLRGGADMIITLKSSDQKNIYNNGKWS